MNDRFTAPPKQQDGPKHPNKKLPEFVPPATPIVPQDPHFPRFCRSNADDNGCVRSWARAEIEAEAKEYGKQSHDCMKAARAFIETLVDWDCVFDIGSIFSLTAEAAKAVNISTPPVRFENVGGWMAAKNSKGVEIANTAAWPGPNKDGVGGVTLAGLIDAYRAAFARDLQEGYGAGKTGTGADKGL